MTTPTGRLAWGQAGIYDAIDDRLVIAAVTRGRFGLVQPVRVEAGSGLQIIVRGSWLGVADCGDGTSGVVGSRLDQVVTANPGPPTGSRADLLWCDVEPDDGEWSLVVIPASGVVGRAGLPLAYLQVPANATLASAIDIRPADSTLERRVLGFHARNDTNVRTATTWDQADALGWTEPAWTLQPGNWYRVRFDAASTRKVSGGLEGRIGVGWHADGAPSTTTILMRSAAIMWRALDTPNHAWVEYTFRHPVTAAPVARVFEGRIWGVGAGNWHPQAVTGQGDGLVLIAEDLGS
jgi:hypothetical protein